MRILIDECLPRKLKHALSDHDVQTVPEAGWSGRKNGELLKLMTGVFDVFITIDNNLEHQQQLEDASVCFIVLKAKNNKLDTLLPLMSEISAVLESVEHGQIIRITDED